MILSRRSIGFWSAAKLNFSTRTGPSSFGLQGGPNPVRDPRPRDRYDAPDIAALLLLLAAIFAAGVIFTRNVSPEEGHPDPYAAACLFGLLVGVTELVARYRDRPLAALSTMSGLVYVVVNGAASGFALWLIRDNGIAADTKLIAPTVAQVLLAGFGTMAFFRTSLFTLRVGESDVAIGPAAVLQVILNAADRACDRFRAGPRSSDVIGIMRGVSFERARIALPLHCFALMQNVSLVEQSSIVQAISGLSGTTGMADDVKAYNMGLLLMNVVGEDVLRQAVSALGPLIKGTIKDDPPILARAVSFRREQVERLPHICDALAPQWLENKPVEQYADELQKTAARVNSDPEKNVIMLAMLREKFGSDTLEQALNLLVACAAPLKTLNQPITAADLGPQASVEKQPRGEIRILGWGSLLWEQDQTIDKSAADRHENFRKQHDRWEPEGPTLPLEFSRVSRRRKGALTIVIDRKNGTPIKVSSARSTRTALADAIKDLREREEAQSEEQIGYVDLFAGTHG